MRLANAIDWPWLPVLALTTPRRRSSGVSCAMRFRPPRILNAPVGLWFSCLTHVSQPSHSSSNGWRSSGDRCMAAYTRGRAAATSSRVGQEFIFDPYCQVGPVADQPVNAPPEKASHVGFLVYSPHLDLQARGVGIAHKPLRDDAGRFGTFRHLIRL